jgi:SHS2 domain-containing protein
VKEILFSRLLRGREDMAKRYKTFDHTADLGIEVYGKNKRQLFTNAGVSLFELITDSGKIEVTTSLTVSVEAINTGDLLVSWLGELLYLHQVKGYLLREFVIHDLKEKRLEATVSGELYDPKRHALLREIKAVTYHQIKVAYEKGRWIARVVLDI